MKLNLIIFLLIILCLPVPAHAQDCNLPNGALGDIIYNNQSKAFQGCTKRGWMAFHAFANADPCTVTAVPGTACADGALYAGELSGIRFYTTPADQVPTAFWGAFTFTTAEVSTTDGLTNTNNLYVHVMAGDGSYNPPPDAAPNGTPNAAVVCHDLVAHGRSDWYLPADAELQVMLNNGGAIGGFVNDSYWSSTERNSGSAYTRQFPGGTTGFSGKAAEWPVRCVHR